MSIPGLPQTMYDQRRSIIGANAYLSYHLGKQMYSGLYGGVNFHYAGVNYYKEGSDGNLNVLDNNGSAEYIIGPGFHLGIQGNLSEHLGMGFQADMITGYSRSDGPEGVGQFSLSLKYRL